MAVSGSANNALRMCSSTDSSTGIAVPTTHELMVASHMLSSMHMSSYEQPCMQGLGVSACFSAIVILFFYMPSMLVAMTCWLCTTVKVLL
jgi:hypothetical protein